MGTVNDLIFTVPTDTIFKKGCDILACFHPLKAFFRVNSETGKKDIVFAKTKDDKIGYDVSGNVYGTPIDIPCGQCRGCRLDYSKDWAVRCMLEAKHYKYNFFITLTYNENSINSCIKVNPIFDKSTGEVSDFFNSFSLVPAHLSKFMKDLRRYFEYHLGHTGIRFFACGEYGSKNMRPHFHLILFNCPIPDLEYIKTSFNGDVYYSSKIIEKIWDKGFVCIGDCNYSTCSYVARYMMKKQKGKHSAFYSDNGLVPPFTRSSRDPGIARSYYDKNRDIIYTYDSLNIVDRDGCAVKVRPPKYFDRLYDIECPDDLNSIKSKREAAAKYSLENKLSQTDLDSESFLKVQEDIFLSKTKKLIRPLE